MLAELCSELEPGYPLDVAWMDVPSIRTQIFEGASEVFYPVRRDFIVVPIQLQHDQVGIVQASIGKSCAGYPSNMSPTR